MSVGWSAAPYLETAPWISGWEPDYFTAFKFYELSGVDRLRAHLSGLTISRSSYSSVGVSQTVTVNGTPQSTARSSGEAVVLSAPFLEPFQVAAFGSLPITSPETVDQVIVLVHADEKSAAVNVELLLERLDSTRLADGNTLYAYRIKKVEIGTDGRILVAKITADFKPSDHLSPVSLVDLPVTVSR